MEDANLLARGGCRSSNRAYHVPWRFCFYGGNVGPASFLVNSILAGPTAVSLVQRPGVAPRYRTRGGETDLPGHPLTLDFNVERITDIVFFGLM